MQPDQDADNIKSAFNSQSNQAEKNNDVDINYGVLEKQARQKQEALLQQNQNQSMEYTEPMPLAQTVGLQSIPESILDELTIKPIPDKQLSRARNRQELFLQKRRKSKQRKVVAKRTNFFLKLFTAVVMLVGLWLFMSAGFWYLSPQQIQIQHTDNGFAFIQDTDVIKTLKPSLQYPLYSLAPEKLSAILKKRFPEIASVSVRRRLFPLRLDVVLTEKPIWGVLFHLSPSSSSTVPAIEQAIDGTLNKTNAAAPPVYKHAGVLHPGERPAYVPTVKLSASQQKVLYYEPAIITQQKRLDKKQLNYLEQTLSLIQAGQAKLNPYKTILLWVDARNPEDAYFYFSNIKIHVGAIDPLLKERTSRLFELLPLIEEQKTQLDYVDLAWRNQMTFKMKGNLTHTEALQQ